MLEVRNASYAPSRDNALLLRDVVDGSYYAFRVFHAGMSTPVPIANGGTGPGTAYDKAGVAKSGDKLTYANEDNWVPVLAGGRILWVSGKYAKVVA